MSLSNRDSWLIITLQIFPWFKCQSSGHAVKLFLIRNKAWSEAMSSLTLILPTIIYSNKLDFLNFLNILAKLCILWCRVSQLNFKFVGHPFTTGTCNIHHWNTVVDCLDNLLFLNFCREALSWNCPSLSETILKERNLTSMQRSLGNPIPKSKIIHNSQTDYLKHSYFQQLLSTATVTQWKHYLITLRFHTT